MSRHDARISLLQMRDHAAEAVAMAGGRSPDDLDDDRVLELVLSRLVEIVGEAATRVPEPIRAAHPQVPWRQIIGMRNRLIHGYDAVDLDVLWQIVAEDLPALVAALDGILDELADADRA